jgi:hypothetical protein
MGADRAREFQKGAVSIVYTVAAISHVPSDTANVLHFADGSSTDSRLALAYIELVHLSRVL